MILKLKILRHLKSKGLKVESEDKKIESMILNGSLEVAGIDMESGEMLYQFTDKLKQQDPELFQDINHYFHTEMMSLWQYGFIEMDITDDNPTVKLTPKAFDRSQVRKLSKENQFSLKEILRVLRTEE